MCTICQSLNPSSPYDFHGLSNPEGLDLIQSDEEVISTNGNSVDVETGGATTNQVYNLDQIADQLTNGYWESTGRSERSFDLGGDRSLTADITQLTAEAQNLARNALDAWSDVTGIIFNYYTPPTVDRQVNETGDAAANSGTNAFLQVGEQFNGTLGTAGDRDWIAINLTSGQTHTISLAGDGSASELNDPYLRLYDSSGNLVAFNDDSTGLDSEIQFTPAVGGTYYIAAGSYNDAGTGNYVVNFTEGASSGGPDLTFDDNDDGAYASSSISGGTILSSAINISTDWISTYGTSLESYSYQTYLHEIGHALGLGHGGNYNGNASYSTDALYANDSWQATVMSYFSETQNSFVSASFRYVSTPQIADILAIQNLYGDGGARGGNTTYGAGATADANLNLFNGQANSIYDSDGIDHIDLSSSSSSQRLDLNAETFSDINGYVGNLGIARGTEIENATTGGGADTVIGNNAANRIDAGTANDTIYGRGGADVLIGGLGDDTLYGGIDNDRLVGGGDDDVMLGGFGNDRLEGGFGADTLYGEDGDDALFGGYGDDILSGGAGIDRLFGESGNDRLVGGSGTDYLLGGTGNDTLTGGAGADIVQGQGGNDTLFGGTEGDLLAGGAGSDRLYGEAGNDTITGGAGVDFLIGGSGDDRLEGGGEGDVLRAGEDNDVLIGGTGNDFLFGEGGNDVIYGQTGTDHITGGAGNDIMIGGADSDIFFFADGFGTDRINDFEVAIDLIDFSLLSGITSFADLTANHLSDSSGGATIAVGGDILVLRDVLMADLDDSAFVF